MLKQYFVLCSMFKKTEKYYIILIKININASVKDNQKDWETEEMLNLRP